MKKIKDYEEEIYKCSRCGLCQSICPVYKVTLNECSVSKAKFNMLNGIIRGDLSLNKRIKSYMDLCTGCNACKNFCPSDIDAREIFIAVKNEYYSINKKRSFGEKLENSYALFKAALFCAKIGFSLYRLLKIDKLINQLEPILFKTGVLGKRILLLNSLAKGSNWHQEVLQSSKKSKKAIYFNGCFNQFINPETECAVKKILSDSEIELVKKDFECCGVSYLNDGNLSVFKELIRINLSKIDEDFDYILTDCSSCFDVLKSYKDYDDSPLAKDVSGKITSVYDLIKGMDFDALNPIKVTVHKPCHDDYEFIELVKRIKNVEFVESEDYDKCCGFSGKFALKNSEISREISKRKAQHFLKTNADVILTTCPACVLGINQGLIEEGTEMSMSKPVVMNLYKFIADYCKLSRSV